MAANSQFTSSFKRVDLSKTESDTVEQTIELAKDFASQMLKKNDIVCLIGDLGAGKTHFVKGMASAFGADLAQVSSPTYTLVNEYDTSLPIFPFDLYRLNAVQEVVDIGFEEYLYSDGLSIIEWPNLIVEMLPTPFWLVQITSLSEKKRQIHICQCTH